MSKKHKKHHKSEKSIQEDKPGIKLVLKVGTPDQREESPPPPDEHDADKKHKHKKKKKKHKHHKDESEKKEKEKKKPKPEDLDISDVDDEVSEPPPKKQAIAEEHTDSPVPAFAVGRNLRERKNVEDEHTPLQRCIDYVHKLLLRKDMNGFFAYPVTDNIAPSYSKIIQTPMDFSTMGEKIEDNEYPSLNEYREDFKLMCNNCMTYNHPETIYYKDAEKLLKVGIRTMSKEKMITLKRSIPLFAMVSDQEMGIDQDLAADGSPMQLKPATPKPKIKKPIMTKFEAFPDRLTPEQILAQAQDAAKDAAEQLTLRKPNTKFGFLRRREDGSTTLNLLNPGNDGIVSERERVVNLGTLVGKLQAGTSTLAGFKEDKRNKALPVNYLNYGPYSSYAPVYDSSQANLSKDDSDLLMTAYGDEAGIQYAYSIRHFVAESGDYAVRMVDNLLDIITDGDHSKAIQALQKVEDSQKEQTPEIKTENDPPTSGIEIKQEVITDQDVDPTICPAGQDTSNIDFQSVRSLSELGIDVSFVDDVETQLKQEDEMQEKLDHTSSLLQDLQKTQYERLGQSLPAHLGEVSGPDDKEQQLAQKVTEELTDLVKQVKPHDIASVKSIRTAMGVTFDPEDLINHNDQGQGDSSEAAAKNEVTTVAAADTTTFDTHMDDLAQNLDPISDAEATNPDGFQNTDSFAPTSGGDLTDYMNRGGSLDNCDLSDLTTNVGNDLGSVAMDTGEI